MNIKIIVTGASGLVGSKFVEINKDKFDIIPASFPEFDMTVPSQVAKKFREVKPDYVVNFAAFTDVTLAEDQRNKKEDSCWNINVEGTKNIVEALPEGTKLIHISTDMVFPGSEEFPGPYSEDSTPEKNPDKVTWYGYTKGEAERIVQNSLGDKAAILRLIYPFSAHFEGKLDYVRKPLSLYDQGKLYPMFTDQQVSVVLVDDVARVLEKIIEKDAKGVFHASSEDTTTPYELTSYVIEKVRGVKNAVKPSSLDDFLKTAGNPVRYPKFGGLRVEKTEKQLGISLGTWKDMVDRFKMQFI